MLGASRLISRSVELANEILDRHKGIELIWPVSGVLRFVAADLPRLAAFLWDLRLAIEDGGMSVSIGIIEQSGDFYKDLEEVEDRVRHQKDAKTGAEALPTLPYFAPCQIQPLLSANYWEARYDEPSRRDLRSRQSKLREELHYAKRPSLSWGLNLGGTKLPEDMDDLVISEADSYVALLKADVDGLGRLLTRLKFEELGRELEVPAPEAGRLFSVALNDCVVGSVQAGFDELSPRSANRFYPFVPFIAAGDDLFVASQRHLALELACKVGRDYAERTRENNVIQKALAVSGLKDEPLTLSFGILFAKKGFPMEAGSEMAEELVRNAKTKRHALKYKEGCVDFHWLASTGREQVGEARMRGETVRDGEVTMHLHTRPWVLSELEQALEGAEKLARLPRRKLKQLEPILRLGTDFSDLAYERWWSGLRREERELFEKALSLLQWPSHEGRPELWVDGANRFLELSLLTEITAHGDA
jgi:hypothetical protein